MYVIYDYIDDCFSVFSENAPWSRYFNADIKQGKTLKNKEPKQSKNMHVIYMYHPLAS